MEGMRDTKNTKNATNTKNQTDDTNTHTHTLRLLSRARITHPIESTRKRPKVEFLGGKIGKANDRVGGERDQH